MTVEIEHQPTLDLIPSSEPKLSTTSDMPRVEKKPDVAAPILEAEKPAEEAEVPEESATPEKPEDPPASDKPKAKGVQKRIDELVKQREEEKAEKLRLLAIVEQINKPKQEPKVEREDDPEPQRPTRDAFADPTDYEAALNEYVDSKSSWTARRAVKEAFAEQDKKAEQRQIEEGRKAAQEAYAARVEKASVKYPDYREVAESPDVSVSMAMAHAITQSEHGPDIAYHLGKHPEEAKRISSLNPALQLMEIGLIVAKLTAEPKAEPAKPEITKPAVSAAPKPIKPLGAGASEVRKTPEEESMDEYAARRQKELDAERKRPGMRH